MQEEENDETTEEEDEVAAATKWNTLHLFRAIEEDDVDSIVWIMSNLEVDMTYYVPELLYSGLGYTQIDRRLYDVHVLHWAAYHGSVRALKLFIEEYGEDDVNVRSSDSEFTPLHLAANIEHPGDTLKYLLSVPGIDVNAEDACGTTPMEYLLNSVYGSGLEKNVLKLLRAGAYPPDDWRELKGEMSDVKRIFERVVLAETLMSVRHCKRLGVKSKLNVLPDDLFEKLIKEFF